VAHLRQTGDWTARDRARLGSEMEMLLQQSLMKQFMASVQPKQYDEVVENVLLRKLSPYEAVNILLNEKTDSAGSKEH
jgi:hypothetical protein